MPNPRGYIRLVAIVAAMLLVFVGCKKSSTTATGGSSSADAYATGVCGAINAWLETIQGGAQGLQENPPTSAEQGKTAVVGYLDDVVTATDTMVSAIEALGAPDVPDGEEIHATLQSALNKVKDVFSQARDEASQASTSDPAAFQAQMEALGTTLGSASAEVDESLSSVSGAELDSAFQDSPECQQLMNTTASVSP